MNKLLLYDDEKAAVTRYIKKLRNIDYVNQECDIVTIKREKFKDEIKILEKRRLETRKKISWSEESVFDDIDIMIIDYDLINPEETDLYLTGELVAYLARCFSKCGLIIGLNQFQLDFDLSMKGHPESYCDLNINSNVLDNNGLWSDERDEFRPWHWVKIPLYLESMHEKIKEITENIETPLLNLLGLEKIIKFFPRSVTSFLQQKPEKMTFKEFVLNSGNGLRWRKDDETTNDMMARISAARLSKWIERLILPGHDIIVDAPHIVWRFPSLLNGEFENVDSWNKTTLSKKYDELGIDSKKIKDFRYENSKWVSRPVWFWNEISNFSKIEEVKNPWSRREPPFVFCEDTSCFFEMTNCKEFLIDSDSSYLKRYVKLIPKYDYQPKVRMM
ncbi:MAG: hypothetical protein Q8N88_01605 [Nanoarchaeota archaeon]|nr:hypothetical protein [Nanoarchaeota archaeon]